MAEYLIMKAVEFDKLPVSFRKHYPSIEKMRSHGWWLQKKYDGCFGMAVLREDGGSQMLSRTGEDYSTSCRHILGALAQHMTAYRGTGWVEAVVLGEVWNPTLDFPTISGKFRKRAPAPELVFVANDILPAGLNTSMCYEDRYEELLSLLDGDCPHVLLAETWQDGRWEDANSHAAQWCAAGGFDGAILRAPHCAYTVGTVKRGEIVKIKPTLTLDLRCVGVSAGEGKHEGKIGSLIVAFRGQHVGVGTGLSDVDREKPDDYWVGSIVEVEAMGVSTEGKLREPRLKGIRIDKLEPDE